jgi:hypothetical protein
MKKIILITGIVAGLVACSIWACNADKGSTTYTISETGKQQPDKDSLVRKGEYLVMIMGCHDCHSPKIMGKFGPEPDPDHLLSGHPSSLPFPKPDTTALKSFVLFNQISTAAAGPWGISFAANLTSDESGIGTWSEQQFITAIRKGKLKGQENGRAILPPMPWPTYSAHLKDEDLKAIFYYLKSTKPVYNVVPAPVDLHKG